MMVSERIQALVHKLDVAGTRWLNYVALTLAVAALAVWYDTHCYLNFSAPEAMDAAQVARNLAEGNGFSTDFIRPFSISLLEKHNHAVMGVQSAGAGKVDYAQVYGRHPDLANAPLYPVILAGLFKLTSPQWELEKHKAFWSDGGHFVRYKPEFGIAVFNQILLLVAVWLTFLVAKTIFDAPAAWLAAAFMLGSDVLWKFSVSGLPVILLLVIFLCIFWCLAKFEALAKAENLDQRRRFFLAAVLGFLAGLGMLTHYSFGWLILPLVVYFAIFGGVRRVGLAVVAVLVFGLVVSPWLVRNFAVSGTFFGTAGYAVMEGTMAFPGSRLMQSLTPDLTSAHWMLPYFIKMQVNLRWLVQNEILHLGGGWMGVLFLAGLLLGLRNIVARRLRYFTLICLGVFLVVTAMGRTQWSTLAPELNTENMLVLLMPMVVIFGVAFFITLLSQMNVPVPPVRYAVMVLVFLLVRLNFVLTLLPPKTSPAAYPPYYPPDIQKFCAWMKPGELVMSDIPWAVAWYGRQQCTWTTVNCRYEFVALNDFVKPVNALYLTLLTLDGRLMSECLQGGVDNWSNFAYRSVALTELPNNFPLSNFPLESFGSGLFLSDRRRW